MNQSLAPTSKTVAVGPIAGLVAYGLTAAGVEDPAMHTSLTTMLTWGLTYLLGFKWP